MKKSHLLFTHTLTAFFALLINISCYKSGSTASLSTEGDSLLETASGRLSNEQIIALADSLEQAKAVSTFKAADTRAFALFQLGNSRAAEKELKSALNKTPMDAADSLNYYRCISTMTEILSLKKDDESVLRTALPVIEDIVRMADEENPNVLVAYDLLRRITLHVGISQMRLGKQSEAAESFGMSYDYTIRLSAADSSSISLANAAILIGNIVDQYIENKDYALADQWLAHQDDFTQKVELCPEAQPEVIDMVLSYKYINHAVLADRLHRSEEADLAYSKYKLTSYAQTSVGILSEAEFLLRAQRYAAAADAYTILGRYFSERDIRPSLDNMHELKNKFTANYQAGRNDSALAVASYVFEHLDSAIAEQKQNDAAELATIYETQKKDAEIAQQQMALNRLRQIGLIVTIVLLSIFFIAYSIYRHIVQRRLASANAQLEQKNAELVVANARAEESSQMKTNFIQQISHEIRTPLNILSGFAQLVTTPGMDLDDESKADLNGQIIENTDRITGLVNKMLDLAEASSQTVVDCNDELAALQLAKAAVKNAKIEEAKHLNFCIQAENEAAETILYTNQRYATRALELLLDNAQKFTRKAEAYHSMLDDSHKESVWLRITRRHEWVDFIVEDTGTGVPADKAEYIFENFVQLDNYYDGTGIGLTVARSLARRMGGDIVLDTAYTNGARFVLTLPVLAPKTSA